MKISVIVPVYNVKPYLFDCINSIIDQTYKNLQIIIVDDGSTDGSSEICDQLMKIDKRIIVIHQTNKGLSAARNAGIEVANGQLISFVDSDDCIHPQMYEFMLSQFRNESIDVVCVNFDKVTELPKRFTLIQRAQFEIVESKKAMELYLDNWDGYWVIACAKLYKKELFDEVRYPIGKVHEDEFISYQIIYKAKKIAFTELKLYYYLQRDNSIMSKRTYLSTINRIEAYLQRNKFLKENNYNAIIYKKDVDMSLNAIRSCYNSKKYIDKDTKNKLIDLYKQWYSINKKVLRIKEKVYVLFHFLINKVG